MRTDRILFLTISYFVLFLSDLCSLILFSRKYNQPIVDEEMADLTRKGFSSQTNKKISWVKNMFDEWRKYRNSSETMGMIELDLDNDATISPLSLNYSICRFLTEIKKLDGSDFPPKTLKDIILSLQFYLETRGYTYHLIDDDLFREIRFTLDNLMKRRTILGLGNHVRQAQIITFEDEELMWKKGVLGSGSPRQLVDTILYKVGLCCALRAGKEHRVLRSIGRNSQFKFAYDFDNQLYVEYREDIGLKTNKGGLKHTKVTPKIVNIYPGPDPNRCLVSLLQKYTALLPKERRSDAFYLRPLARAKEGVWFADAPIGINSLQSTVKRLCESAGLVGYYTNHSLRATSATRMYNADIPEQCIQEVTGHRSLAVRSYKKTSVNLKRKASASISNFVKRR